MIAFFYNAQALFGILAPLGTAKVYPRINHNLPAVAAFQFRLILEKLHRLITAGTVYIENIFRLPKPLILSGTFDHITPVHIPANRF
jgi:hypothetical protein